MLLYALICLCLALLGVAGLQFLYMFYIERLDRERKKRLHELEVRCRNLTARLEEAEQRIARQQDLINEFYEESGEEVWADVIDEH